MGGIDLSTFDINSRRRGPDIRGRLFALAESGTGADLTAATAANHGSGNLGRNLSLARFAPRSISVTAVNRGASGLLSPRSMAKLREKGDPLLGDAEVEEWGMVGFDSLAPGDGDKLDGELPKRGVGSSWDFEVPAKKSRSLSLRSLTKCKLSIRKRPALRRTLSSVGDIREVQDENCSAFDISSCSSTAVVTPSLSSIAYDDSSDSKSECASETASTSECGSVVGDSESSDWSNDKHGDVAPSGWAEWDVEERTSYVVPIDEKQRENWISLVREFFPANRAGHIRRFFLRGLGGSRRESMQVWA